MTQATNQATESEAVEELDEKDLQNANGGVKFPIPIDITPNYPTPLPVDTI